MKKQRIYWDCANSGSIIRSLKRWIWQQFRPNVATVEDVSMRDCTASCPVRTLERPAFRWSEFPLFAGLHVFAVLGLEGQAIFVRLVSFRWVNVFSGEDFLSIHNNPTVKAVGRFLFRNRAFVEKVIIVAVGCAHESCCTPLCQEFNRPATSCPRGKQFSSTGFGFLTEKGNPNKELGKFRRRY
jgi:hypothetical protein